MLIISNKCLYGLTTFVTLVVKCLHKKWFFTYTSKLYQYGYTQEHVDRLLNKLCVLFQKGHVSKNNNVLVEFVPIYQTFLESDLIKLLLISLVGSKFKSAPNLAKIFPCQTFCYTVTTISPTDWATSGSDLLEQLLSSDRTS